MSRRLVWLLALVPLVLPLAALALASLSVSPSSLSFNERCVRTDAKEKTVTVTNDKNPAATDVRVGVSPSAMAKVFPLSGKTAVPTLAPDQSFTFDVGFVPQRDGAHTAKAVVTYNASEVSSSATPSPAPKAGKTTVALEGEGIDRFIDASPKAVDFGKVRVGRKGPRKTVTVYDDGDTPLKVTSVFIGGRHARDFSVSPQSSATITDGDPHKLTVSFTPREAGARAAELFIRSNSCEDRLFTVALGGLGIEPEIAAIPEEVTFPEAMVGAPRKREELTIANQGGLPLRVSGIHLDVEEETPFSIPKIPSLPRTLRPNADFVLNVYFEPSEPGPAEATLEVMSNDPDTKRLKVKLEGTALPPPSPTPSPSASPVPSPTASSAPGAGFSIGEYLAELGIAAAVAGFFAMLVVVRRVRGIPE